MAYYMDLAIAHSEGHQNSQCLGLFVAIKQILTPHPDVT